MLLKLRVHCYAAIACLFLAGQGWAATIYSFYDGGVDGSLVIQLSAADPVTSTTPVFPPAFTFAILQPGAFGINPTLSGVKADGFTVGGGTKLVVQFQGGIFPSTPGTYALVPLTFQMVDPQTVATPLGSRLQSSALLFVDLELAKSLSRSLDTMVIGNDVVHIPEPAGVVLASLGCGLWLVSRIKTAYGRRAVH